MKILLSIIFISLLSFSSSGQSEEPILITWKDLEDVEYEEVYVDSADVWFMRPVFSSSVLALANKNIQIAGIYIDLEMEYTLLTRNSVKNLGKHNPLNNQLNEMIQLESFFPSNLENGESTGLSGILILNDSNPYRLSFILENPEVVKK